MSQTSIERIRGPHDGVVELILIQSADWESDPFLVKHLREKIAAYQAYLGSDDFHRHYANCSGVIVLETTHFPPEELQQMLASAGVEVRITKAFPAPEDIELIRETSAGDVELVLSQLQDWESDPFLVKTLRGTIAIYKEYLASEIFRESFGQAQGRIVLETVFAPPSDIRSMLKADGVSIQMADMPAAPTATVEAPKAAAPAAAPAPAAPAPAVAEEPKKPMFVQRKPEVDPDSWEDAYDDPYGDPELAASGGKVTPAVIGAGVVTLLCLAGFLYFFLGLGATPVPTSPTMVPASSITGQGTPKEQYATVVVRPNPRTFVMIPIQSSTTGKSETYFLFGSLDSKKLLIFAKQKDCQILDKFKIEKHPVTGEESKVPAWKKDLLKSPDKMEKRTFTGRLEHAQRRSNGPVELVLPDQNRNVNKLYKKLNIQFPPDSMIMVVGEKPRGGGGGGIFTLVFFIATVVAGGVAFAMFRQSSRSF